MARNSKNWEHEFNPKIIIKRQKRKKHWKDSVGKFFIDKPTRANKE